MKFNQSISLGEIGRLLEAEIIGNEALMISGINEIHKVEPGDVSFVDHPKYYKKVLNSAASAVLINSKEVDNPQGKSLIYSEDPFQDYNKLVKIFHPKPDKEAIQKTGKIHPTAIVYPNCYIGPDVTIGAHSIIYPNVSIYNQVDIGENVIVQSNTTIGSDAFYYQKRAGAYQPLLSCGFVKIEDDVEIGAGCTIDRGVSGITRIGQGTKIDNQVHVGHGVEIGEHCLIAAQTGIAGKTRIGNNVTIWGQVGINKDLDIEDDVVILGQSGVGSKCEKGKRYFGSPAIEAREKAKELVIMKHLPKIWDKLKSL